MTDKPGSVVDNHSSGTLVTKGLKQPTRIQLRAATLDSYLVLLRVGFTLPRTVTSRAVRSYRTFSPLPNHTSLSTHLTVVLRTSRLIWRYIFCCTSRRLAPPRRYLAPCSAEPGLSSDPVLERRKATKEELGPAIAQLTRAQLSRVQNFAQAASTLVSRA